MINNVSGGWWQVPAGVNNVVSSVILRVFDWFFIKREPKNIVVPGKPFVSSFSNSFQRRQHNRPHNARLTIQHDQSNWRSHQRQSVFLTKGQLVKPTRVSTSSGFQKRNPSEVSLKWVTVHWGFSESMTQLSKRYQHGFCLNDDSPPCPSENPTQASVAFKRMRVCCWQEIPHSFQGGKLAPA